MDLLSNIAVNLAFPATLLISAFFALLTASIYGYLAWRLQQRVVSSSEARLAWQLFIMWWLCLAGTTLVGGVLNLLGAFDITSLPLFITITQLNLLIICVALWGLLYYLIYLFTGNSASLLPLSAFYVLYYALLVYYITASAPIDVSVGRWTTTISYANEMTGPFFILVLVLLTAPQILGALVYFTLFFRVRDATQKYRILLVSWSLIAWFGSALIAPLVGLSSHDWWQIVSRLIALSATLVILIAYFPPRWIRERYGVISLSDRESAA